MKSMLQYSKEITNFSAAIDIDPDSAKTNYNLGNAYGRQDKSDSAIKAYRRLSASTRPMQRHITI